MSRSGFGEGHEGLDSGQGRGSEMPLALLVMLLTSGLQNDYIAM